MRNELKDVLMILLEPRSLQRGYFEAEGIRKLMNDHLQGGRVLTGRIWRLLMFELWHRNFLEKFTNSPGLLSLPIAANSAIHAVSAPPVSPSALATARAGE
jgi:hypothetical protein